MTNERTLTRSQLVAAFTVWEEERRAKPEQFDTSFATFDEMTPGACAENQVDYVFDILDRKEEDKCQS